MNRDDHVWGSRSGIQKAIRRGDLDLGKSAFDALWKEKQHRAWLQWRIVSILQEDSLTMVGELAGFYEELKQHKRDSTGEEKVWRKFIYRCIVCPAQQDAHGLVKLAQEKEFESDHPELIRTRSFTDHLSDESPSDIAGRAADWARSYRKLSAYEDAAVEILLRRSAKGGMLGDQITPTAGIVLIALRGLFPEELRAKLKAGAAAWQERAGRSKPVSIPMPWFAFDMHTQVGLIALSATARKTNTDKAWLRRLWFMCESSTVPKHHTEFIRPTPTPTIWQCMWWPQWVSYALTTSTDDAKASRKHWNTVLKPKVQGLVEYLLRKRSQ